MPPYRVPEYRRRIREKAEKNKQEAIDEGERAAKRADIHEIVAAIEAINQKYDSETHKAESRHKWDRLWEVLGVAGLWIDAAVGIAAILYGTHDAKKQRGVMSDQLIAMRGQLDAFAASQRAFVTMVRLDSDIGVIHASTGAAENWVILPLWENSGNTSTAQLSIATACGVFEWELDDPFAYIDWSKNVNPAIIGPKGRGHAGHCPTYIDTNIISSVNVQKWFFYIVGRACYQDILNKGIWHATDFSARITAFIKNGNILKFTGQNSGPHNCADTDCPDYKSACTGTVK